MFMYKASARFRSMSIFNNAVYSNKHEEKPEIPPVKLTVPKGGFLENKNLSHAKQLFDESRFYKNKVLTGKVIKVMKIGAVVDMKGTEGFIHISEMADRWIDHPNEVLKKGQHVKVKILKIEKLNVKGKRKIKIKLTIKGVEVLK